MKIEYALWGVNDNIDTGNCYRDIVYTNGCIENNVTAILSEKCDGFLDCHIYNKELQPTTSQDPCPGIEKELTVNYSCMSNTTDVYTEPPSKTTYPSKSPTINGYTYAPTSLITNNIPFVNSTHEHYSSCGGNYRMVLECPSWSSGPVIEWAEFKCGPLCPNCIPYEECTAYDIDIRKYIQERCDNVISNRYICDLNMRELRDNDFRYSSNGLEECTTRRDIMVTNMYVTGEYSCPGNF